MILQATGTSKYILVFRGIIAFTAHHSFSKPVCNIQIGLTFPLYIITIPAFVLTLYDFWSIGITTSCASNTFQLWDGVQPPGGGIAVRVKSKSFYISQQYSVRVIPAQRRARQQQKHKQAEGLAEPGRLWRASQGHGAR